MQRCPWPKNELAIQYHDEEWGVPLYDDQKHFEFLTLESAQAGLSWDTVLKKREHYRLAFANFDPNGVSQFGAKEVEAMMANPGLIRNRQKLLAAINNAVCFLNVQNEFGTFNAYIWQFVGNSPICNHWQALDQIPATSAESTAFSKDLKKRGFKFIGPTTCYAHLQAAGLINDHLIGCFRHQEVQALYSAQKHPGPAF